MKLAQFFNQTKVETVSVISETSEYLLRISSQLYYKNDPEVIEICPIYK